MTWRGCLIRLVHMIPTSLFSQANAKGARSTALHALQWMIPSLVSGEALLVWAGAPQWTLVLIGVAIGSVIFVFLFAFVYLLFKDRDALRSESYSIAKLAIEKGMIGDDLLGVIENESSSVTAKAVQAPQVSEEGGTR